MKTILVGRECLREQFTNGAGGKEAESVMSGRETDPRFLGIGRKTRLLLRPFFTQKGIREEPIRGEIGVGAGAS